MKYKLTFIILILIFLFQGCAANGEQIESAQTISPQASLPDESQAATITPQETEIVQEEPKDNEINNESLVLPTVKNETGKVLIQTVSANTKYPYNTYIISSINGENIVIDPTEMPKKDIVDINPVAIISTHSHADHFDRIFIDSYDCETLLCEVGELNTKDFTIKSILSSHGNDIIDEKSNNKIMIIEVDGLRIAHMGDIGQTALTDEQINELGKIDIAFMQFENSYSSMTLKNEKGFDLIEKLKPVIVIPTHYTDAALSVLKERYGEIIEYEEAMEISKTDLPEGHLNVYRILNNHRYK